VSNSAFDVAIVGYGPVGQALALNLLQHGRRVVIVERWPALYSLPRAVSYDHEAARILQSLGLAEAMAPHTSYTDIYEWRNGKGELLLEFTDRDDIAISGWPQAIGFHQPSLEAVLDSHVRAFGEQVELLQGWEAVDADETASLVNLRIRSTTKPTEERTLQARYVVGCDGASSFVRQAMGSAYDYMGFTADWLVVDIKPKNPGAYENHVVQVCDPARPTTLVTGGPDRRRLEFMLLPGEDKTEMNTVEHAWRLSAVHGWTPENAELERHAVYTFRGAVVNRWRRGRMMLAGDAAHLTPPFAAQGLCMGLRDMQALAWRLNYILDGIADEDLLDSYGPERSAHARVLIEFAIALGKVICVLDPVAAEKRDQDMRSGNREVASRYPLPRLGASRLQDNSDPRAGVLALQARIRVGEQVGLLNDVLGQGFMLLTLDEDQDLGLSADQRAFLETIGARIVSFAPHSTVRDIDGSYRRWFAQLDSRAALVRPDYYLFGTGEPAALVAALQSAVRWRT
jgi:2-polyprenyl-6-methoxyphenol hydroxylase-like FAD-dependent oxidoreductase